MNDLKKIQKKLNKEFGNKIISYEKNGAVALEGNVDNWDEVIKAGFIAADSAYRGVINDLHYKDMKKFKYRTPTALDQSLSGKSYDVVIIGAGIIGCSIARELSRWDISILLLDKESDVAMQASSRNDGMIHPGLSPKVGSLKSKYNIEGNKLYSKIGRELGVKINRCGSYIVFDKKRHRLLWPFIKNKVDKLGLEGVERLSREELLKREPHLNKDIRWGVFMPTTGITSPYKMTIAYAENAIMNGVDISLDTMVTSMDVCENSIKTLITNRGEIKCGSVINAAGVFADEIADMAEDRFFTIHPRKGEIVLLDKKKGGRLSAVVGRFPPLRGSSHSKGGGILRTLEGNILLGPNALEQPNKEDFTTRNSSISNLLDKHLPLIDGLGRNDVITYCAGNRAATYKEDFIIEKSQKIANLIYAAGIQSPGFASAPAIAKKVESLVLAVLQKNRMVTSKYNWDRYRKAPPNIMEMSDKEKNKLIQSNSDYGLIVCRCEGISKGEIIDCLNSPIPVRTVDGIKRRVRAGMGRCQGGFCLPPIMKIIEEEVSVSMKDITKRGGKSKMVVSETKENEKI